METDKKCLELTHLYKRRMFTWFERVQVCLPLSCPSEPNDSGIHTDTLYIFLIFSSPPYAVSIFHLAAVKHDNSLSVFLVIHQRNSCKVVQEWI